MSQTFDLDFVIFQDTKRKHMGKITSLKVIIGETGQDKLGKMTPVKI